MLLTATAIANTENIDSITKKAGADGADSRSNIVTPIIPIDTRSIAMFGTKLSNFMVNSSHQLI